MSILRRTLISTIFDGQCVRPDYLSALLKIVIDESDVHRSYQFFDAERRRDGIVYRIGQHEIYWLPGTGLRRPELIVRDDGLRLQLLDMLAVNPQSGQDDGAKV